MEFDKNLTAVEGNFLLSWIAGVMGSLVESNGFGKERIENCGDLVCFVIFVAAIGLNHAPIL